MQQRKSIIESLALATELYGKAVSDAGRKLWFRLLADYTPDEITGAFANYFKHGEPFMPKPSDIVKLIDGTSEDRSIEAWNKAVAAIGAAGTYNSVVFDDPVIHAVVRDMGGWIEFCAMPSDEKQQRFVMLEFQKRYGAYQRRGPAHYPAKLIGQHEASNEQNGFADRVKPPLVIGDEDKARLVYRGGNVETPKPKRLASVVPKLGIALNDQDDAA